MTGAVGNVEVFEGDPTRIAVSGEIDLSNVVNLQSHIEAALDGARSVVLDLREVTFMGSEGVRLVYTVSQSLEGTGEMTVLVDKGGIPAQVLAMTRMDERVKIVNDMADFGDS